MSGERLRGAAFAIVGVALLTAPAIACAAPGGAPAVAAAAQHRHPSRVSVATGRAHAALSLNPGPSVSVMIVGAGNVILGQPGEISVAATAVKTSRGACGIAAATPLAALVDLRRVGGPPFSIRDYGHCTTSPRNSGQLFVNSLDGETNHGQNGWEYKVGNRSGTTGAADPSGAFGDGHLLASGSKVLWFWCQSVAGGCQRTLEAAAPASGTPGHTLSVRVIGYDNEGHGQAMSGARVTLAGSSAVTGGSGRVTLRAPSRAGTYSMRASRPGSVPSFPAVVQIR
jgi:hypothetical protein